MTIRGVSGAAALALLLTACGGEAPGNMGEEAAGNAAAAGAPAPPAGAPTPLTPSTNLPAGQGIPGVSAPPPTEQPGPAPAPDAPLVTDPGEDATPDDVDTQGADAAAATSVARRYFAAIEQGRFQQAFQLVEPDTAAAHRGRRAFADSFARYANYNATLRHAGRIDAGAGQRYVTIPVRVTGTVKATGRPFVLEGPVVLHRTADIDGATAEQRSWRIRDVSLTRSGAGA